MHYMNKLLTLFTIGFLFLINDANAQLVDIDSNVYKTVKLGTQTWMASNLNVSHFRNGNPIPHAKTVAEWIQADLDEQPAWCYYKNDSTTEEQYGKLYNWYAVTDPRGLAPDKWHIPNEEEWIRVTTFIGSKKAAGTRMKHTTGWKKNGNGTNTSGLSMLPGGSRSDQGKFSGKGGYGYWWSFDEKGGDDAWGRNLGYSHGYILKNSFIKGNGMSVRCVRD